MKKLLLILIAIIYSTPIFAIVGAGVPTDGYTSGDTCTQIVLGNTTDSCNNVTDCYAASINIVGGTNILTCRWAGLGKYTEWSMAIEPTKEVKECTNPKTNANVSEYTFTTSGGGTDNCAWFANCATGSYFDMNKEKCVACTNTQIAPKVNKNATPENFIINDTVYTINKRGTNLWGMYGPEKCVTCPTGSTPNNNHDECITNTGYTCTATNGTYYTTAYTCTPKIYTIYVFQPDNTNYTIYRYKYNTGLGKNSSSNTNYTTTISPKPTKTKHNFDGYITTNASASENGAKVIDKNGSLIIDTFNEWVADYNTTTPLYIKPTFTPKTYTVIYDNVGTCDDTATYDTKYIIQSTNHNPNICTSFTYPGPTQSGKEFVGWKSDEHGDTIFVAGEVLTELDTEYSNANVQLSPAYAACSAGHFCTSDKKEPCPNGSTSDAGANKKQQCYLSLSDTGTRIKDKTKTINLNELMTDSDNKIYYK